MRPLPLCLPDRLIAFLRRLRADRRGNVLLMTGAAIPLLMVAVGFGIDYARAQRLQTKLDAAADAAALATVDPTLLSVTDDTQVQTAAETMFDEQVKGLSGLTVTYRKSNVVDNSGGSLGTLRKSTFTYTATSTNIFGAILKMANLTIGGTSVASASTPPSINFYIAMDTSPSMLLPTTSAGITALKAGAWWSGGLYYGRADGCDFACHSGDMQLWGNGVYVVDSGQKEIFLNNSPSASNNNTSFFRVSCSSSNVDTVYDSNNNVLGTGATLTSGGTTAQNYCTGYQATALKKRTIVQASNPVTLTYNVTTTTTVKGKSTPVVTTYSQSVSYPDTYWLVQNYSTVNPGASSFNLRTDAESLAAQSVISTAYAFQNKYSGTTAPTYQMQFFTFNLENPLPITKDASGNTSPFGTMTPVKSLLNLGAPPVTIPYLPTSGQWTSQTKGTITTNNFDTDFGTMLSGMQTYLPKSKGAGTSSSPQSVLIIITDGMSDVSSISAMTTANIAACTTIKQYTRIAILYTQYLPETINYTARSDFTNYANTVVPQIQGALQQCATQNSDGTYLMQTVSTDGDVSAALNTLFAMSVQSARLVQ